MLGTDQEFGQYYPPTANPHATLLSCLPRTTGAGMRGTRGSFDLEGRLTLDCLSSSGLKNAGAICWSSFLGKDALTPASVIEVNQG